MRVKDFEEFRSPSRKPWLLLVLLLAAGIWYWRSQPKPHPDTAPVPAAPEAPVATTAAAKPAKAGGEGVEGVAPAETAAPMAAVPATSQAKLAEAKQLEQSGAFAEARMEYLKLRDELQDNPALRGEIESTIGRLSIALVTTARPWPGVKDTYVVQAGNSVERIARKYGTTIELIVLSNGIRNANVVRQGDLLRVFTGKFRLVANKTRKDMVVFMNDEFFKRYRIGTGRYDKTPAGTFEVTEKITEPVWWRPDGTEVPFGAPENILGSRWLTIRATGNTPPVRGYGIHGTWDDASIGKDESAGCIRMHNPDVEELYTILPVGTHLVIEE